jgi:hypothetical protein
MNLMNIFELKLNSKQGEVQMGRQQSKRKNLININIISPLLFIILMLAILPLNPVSANNGGTVGAVFEKDFGGEFYDELWEDVQDFHDIVDGYVDWDSGFVEDEPYASWWEESGSDDTYADAVELCLFLGHMLRLEPSNDTAMYFSPNGYVEASEVQLGYDDYNGYNIWFFAITCELLTDDYSAYADWLLSIFDGTHMMLSFESEAAMYIHDLSEMADRFMYLLYYPQETIQDAFFSTYVSIDQECHYYNKGRVIAEDDDVADDDYLNSYDAEITVDSTKYVINCGPAV